MISIITPTYNRAYILGTLYESLKQQTSGEFEWIIVDDGSIDETEQLVQEWVDEEKLFELSYYKKVNGGKHRALNFGIPKAKSKFVFIVDSDDKLTADAVACANAWISTIEEDKTIAGVAGLRGYPDGKRIGDYPKNREYIDVKNSHRNRYHLDGDKAEIYRKDLLLQFPFPEFDNEKFIGEGAVWNAIAKAGYKVRWYNKIIYVGNYLQDGLTNHVNELRKKNFCGYTYNTKLNYQVLAFPYNLMAVATYMGMAGEKGLTEQQITYEIGLKKIDLWLCKLIRKLRKMS